MAEKSVREQFLENCVANETTIIQKIMYKSGEHPSAYHRIELESHQNVRRKFQRALDKYRATHHQTK